MAKRPRWRTEANETTGGFVTESLKLERLTTHIGIYGSFTVLVQSSGLFIILFIYLLLLFTENKE